MIWRDSRPCSHPMPWWFDPARNHCAVSRHCSSPIAPGRRHTFVLPGLPARTQVRYRVSAGASQSPTYRFHTMPGAGDVTDREVDLGVSGVGAADSRYTGDGSLSRCSLVLSRGWSRGAKPSAHLRIRLKGAVWHLGAVP